MRIPSPARWWARLSLMVRVMLGASLALVFASILLLFVSTDQDARSARIQIDEHLAGEIDSLLPAIAEWAVIGDYASVEQMFRHRVRRADIRSISWMDDKGRAIEAIDKDVDRRAPRWFVEWTGVLSPGISRTLSIGGRSYGQVTVDMTATPAQNRLWGSFLDHLVILLLALALNVAGIYLVLRNGLRPLSVLTRGADELARGDFTHRIALQGSPELAGLIQAFNRMAEGITAGHAALRDEAERLAVTLSSIGDGVIATDLDGRVEFMNPVAETLTGWTAGEARGHSIQEVFAIINETTRREVECPVDRALREGVVIGLANHTLLISRDGVERAIADSAACIRHADGEPVGAVLVFRDQESERTVARILQESEAELKEAQRIAGVGSWSLNLKTNVLAWSDEVYRIFELAREDLAGNAVAPCYESFLAQVHPDDREAVNRAYTESLETRQPYAIEHRLLMADARIKWVHERCATSYDEDGRPVLSRGTVQDITERKQTEEQLRKLSLAVEQSPESIMITDLEARIEYVNAAFVRNTGYEREEVMGRNPRLLQSGKTPRETYVALWRAMSQGRSWAGEFFNRRKDGGEYTEWATITPLRQADGRVTHYVAIKEDITEQKRMNEELERHREHLEELVAERTRDLTAARDEAERLARAKSEFLANMSHELRTPLNGVLGMARIGVRDSAGRASHETFVRIQDSGAHLLGVINDILDFSKLDAGKLHVERRPFALAAALANATSFVAGAARQKGLAFEVTAAADLPEWVSGDAQRLQQILVNLLSNAVKFTERGEVRLRVARQGEEIWFKVIDTGIGMSEEQAARLFRPFEQADSSTTRKYGGTGLGLAISQNLARLMGGEITVECALGAGCSFTLRLPLPEAQPHLPAHVVDPAAPTERRLAGLRLLAAEDVEVNRLVLEDLLSHE
ncbi:MAG: PAS domain S-box protein, partial [Sulfuritalea sp.]|nr:PAS domain S-box protein [Sulfuritalea sp.]